MTIENGIQALKNLESEYTARIKLLLSKDWIIGVNRLSQVREGVKQSIRILEKIKDKNADVLPIGP